MFPLPIHCFLLLKRLARRLSLPAVCWLIALNGCTHAVFAQALPLNYLGIEHGLSNNSVRCIYQDRDGFMWFGTYDGLNRYDGYEFKVYRNKLNDTNSLPHNYIYAITEDAQRNIWVGTGQGMAVYNRKAAQFYPAYFLSAASKTKTKISSTINVVTTDQFHNVLIGSNGGGFMIQRAGAAIAEQLPVFTSTGKLLSYNVQAITIDRQQQTWLLIKEVGLCRFDYDRQQIVPITKQFSPTSCLESDGKGNLWVGTNHGLFRYNIAGNKVTAAYTKKSGELSSNDIAVLKNDRDGQLWIGSVGGGISILNPATHTFRYLMPAEDKHTLTSESAYAIFEDNEYRKWIGTLKGGVNVIDPQKNQFQTIAHSGVNKNSLIYNFVSSFEEGPGNTLWIGTDGGGISTWNRQQNKFINFAHSPSSPGSLSNNSVSSIEKDHLKQIWIATFGGGVNKFNPATNGFEHYPCINDSTGEENKNTWRVYEDHQRNLWVTTFGNGKLYRLNRNTNRFEVFDQQLNDLVSITEDKAGNLWAGNSYLLTRINTTTKQHLNYEIGKPIRSIFEDSRQNFWLGTEGGGLILFNRLTGELTKRYSVDDGLCNNSVLNIVEDREGYLWLSTFNGLSRFNPKTGSFLNFFQSDGLQSNQFLYNAAATLATGELVFGGINGFNIFYPDSLLARTHFSPVLITSIKANNQPLPQDHAFVTDVTQNNIAALEVPYNTPVAFDFATIEYSSPGKIQYAYFLEGWDRGWTYTTNIRTANYTYLREGTYRLRLKSTNAAGSWNPQETVLKLTIMPPWFRTWWAFTLYALSIGGLIAFYLNYRASQTRLNYKVKLAQINAEKEKEINEKKLSFFTNISHEFRTPLTLIINPAKELLQQTAASGDGQISDTAGTIYRNARRLLSLVDQLLLFRKADSDADQLVLSNINLESLSREVFSCFLQQAKAKSMLYQYNCPTGDYHVYADKEKLEIVLFNLLSNALKYTPEKGAVTVTLSETAGQVAISIEDTGAGIPAHVGNKLYERFYRDDSINHFSSTGFGIGLFLSKHFLDIHKGTIHYQSEIGKGTRFFVSLLKGREHFDESVQFASEIAPSLMLHELVEEPATLTEPTGLESVVTEGQTLLVIDDDPQMRTYLVQVFGEKFQVFQAADGDTGLKIAEHQRPNLIISDINMANMNGIELCARIKASAELRHIPVVLLTGSSSRDSHLKSAEVGADDYIIKPFEKEFLLARVENILKSRSDLQQYFFKEITLQKNDTKISAEDKAFLTECIRIVEEHLLDDQFSVQTLAHAIGMSHSNLYLKVKALSGQTVNGFIRFIRLRKAAQLLISTNANVNEVTLQVGINDKKYFREHFHKLFGMNPSDYIKKFRKPFNSSFSITEKMSR